VKLFVLNLETYLTIFKLRLVRFFKKLILIKKITSYIKQLPFIEGNSPSVNILLFLLAVAYFTIIADFDKDIAIKKNEVGIITATVSKSIHTDCSGILVSIEKIPTLKIAYHLDPSPIYNSDAGLFPPGRSPPQI
jgi:hypothetical protein